METHRAPEDAGPTPAQVLISFCNKLSLIHI